jgi:alanine dehydrogenase
VPSVPIVGHDEILAAISPAEGIDAVRNGFIAHAEGRWQMPPKVYLPSPPHGDFRAMPASGDGIAILKWVTSFPGNPEKGLPTVTGTILVSDATDGTPLAVLDGRAVTALRTGAAAAVASTALASSTAATASIIGCGLHGTWAGRCLVAAGYAEGICVDPYPEAAAKAASELGWAVGTLEEALECDVVTTVTPGHEPVIDVGRLRAGSHVNALGADGPGKAEMTIDAVTSCEVFCDDWEQASHGGEIHGAVAAGVLARGDVRDIGSVLAGRALGRSSNVATTLFDSTGLAIQDLAITLSVLARIKDGSISVDSIEL